MLREERKSNPKLAEYCAKGKQLLEEGKYLLALEYYQAANELDPQHVDALFGQVCAFKALGRFGNAEEMQRRLDAVIQKNPYTNSFEKTSQGQLHKARIKYANMLRTLVLVEKDKYGLKHASFPPEADRELTACEMVVESLEQQLKLKKSDFKSERNAVLVKQSSNVRSIHRVVEKWLSKYERLAKSKLMVTGRDANGVKTFGYSSEAIAELDQMEKEIRFIDAYLPKSSLGRGTFRDIRNRRMKARRNDAQRWACWKTKRHYAWFVFWHLVRSRSAKHGFELSASVRERDNEMRNRIAALDLNDGRAWCQEKTNKLAAFRKSLPKILLGIGIIAGVFIFIYFFWKLLLIIGGIMIVARIFSD